MTRLTKRFVDQLTPDPSGREVTHWDDRLSGFGVRVQPGGAMSWVAMYRTREGRLRKLTVGRVGTLTPEEARQEARQRLAEAQRGGDPAGDKSAARRSITVADLCDWYLREAEGRVKASTLAMDRSRIARHVKPLIGKRRTASLTSEDIERLQAEIAAGKSAKPREGRGGATTGGRGVAARTIGMFATILEFARRRKVIKNNPARGVKKIPDGKQRRFLSLDEIAALGKVMGAAEAAGETPTAIAIIRLLLVSGLRRMEALALPRAWVDAKARCIRFGDTKSGAQVRPIGTAAVKLLNERPAPEEGASAERAAWVFPADRGDGHYIGVPKVLARFCAKAGLEGVTVHVLRHSFAAVAAGMGYSELTIAGLLGHRLSGITVRYAHVPDAALVAAADRVSARVDSALEGRSSAEVVPLVGGSKEAPEQPDSSIRSIRSAS